jgi:hypothetical protein
LEAPYGVHDHSGDFIHGFSRRLYRLPCARRRKILWVHRMDRGDLFSAPGFARSARVRDRAAGGHYAHSGLPSPVGSALPDCALDGTDLALRLNHGGARLLDALQMVSAWKSCTWPLVDV